MFSLGEALVEYDEMCVEQSGLYKPNFTFTWEYNFFTLQVGHFW